MYIYIYIDKSWRAAELVGLCKRLGFIVRNEIIARQRYSETKLFFFSFLRFSFGFVFISFFKNWIFFDFTFHFTTLYCDFLCFGKIQFIFFIIYYLFTLSALPYINLDLGHHFKISYLFFFPFSFWIFSGCIWQKFERNVLSIINYSFSCFGIKKKKKRNYSFSLLKLLFFFLIIWTVVVNKYF